jgi:hypothetical protein
MYTVRKDLIPHDNTKRVYTFTNASIHSISLIQPTQDLYINQELAASSLRISSAAFSATM